MGSLVLTNSSLIYRLAREPFYKTVEDVATLNRLFHRS
jgi:hypothetical protein